MGNAPQVLCCITKNSKKSSKKLISCDKMPFIRHSTYISQEDFQSIFQLRQTIGKGCFSKVKIGYRKADKAQRPYAVKIISKSLLDPSLEADFLNEISILKTIDHPNAVKLLVYDNNNFYFLVTEYLSGGTIMDAVKNCKLTGRKREEYILQLTQQILKGLSYLHKIGIVHRDLKPANMMLTSRNPEALVKIIDFGLSRKFTTNEMFNSFLGTPFFVAPEVINRDYNELCDLWSVGVTIYFLIAGKPPFDASNRKQLLKNIKESKLDLTGDIWKSTDVKIKNLVKNLLQKEPCKRLGLPKAIDHEAFSFVNPKKKPINLKHIENLMSFKRGGNFKLLVKHLAIQTIEETELNDLVTTFYAINGNHDGFISIGELKEAIGSNKIKYKTTEVQEVMKRIDLDGNGYINFSEFLLAASGLGTANNREKIGELFDLIDEDHLGEIDYNVIKKTIMRQGRKLNDTFELKKMVEEETDVEKIDVVKFSKFILE